MKGRAWVIVLTAVLAPVMVVACALAGLRIAQEISTQTRYATSWGAYLASACGVPVLIPIAWLVAKATRPRRPWLAVVVMLAPAATLGYWANLEQPGGEALAFGLAAWVVMLGLVLLAAGYLSSRGWTAAAIALGVVGMAAAADVAIIIEVWHNVGPDGRVMSGAGAPYWILAAMSGVDVGPDRGVAWWVSDDYFLQANVYVFFALFAIPYVVSLCRRHTVPVAAVALSTVE